MSGSEKGIRAFVTTFLQSINVNNQTRELLCRPYFFSNLREALEATRIVGADSGDTRHLGAKAAALSIFEGTKQRFFAQQLLSMKLPSVLPVIDCALADGNAVVVQLVSTAEAMLDRRLADLSDAES